MFAKEILDQQSNDKDDLYFQSALNPLNDERKLEAALEKIGRVPKGFDGKLFLPLLSRSSPAVRLLAVKNIGKLKDESFLDKVSCLAKTESNTLVRREAVSAIGRMRSRYAVPVLISFLHDNDAKVVMQAIRALLVFKTLPKVQESLKALTDHPSELVREAIEKEFGPKTSGRAKNPSHTSSPNFLKNVLVHGDVREVLSMCLTNQFI